MERDIYVNKTIFLWRQEEIDAGDNTKDDDVTRRRGRKVNKKKKKSQQERPPRQPSVGMLEPNETQVYLYFLLVINLLNVI